jgi:RES domain-containing protein
LRQLFTPYHVQAERIVDLCDAATRALLEIDDSVLLCQWKTIARIEQRRPPTWALAARLVAADADGARVPSARHPGGVDLVLWRWNGEGTARVLVRDPLADLPRDGSSWPHRH